MTTISWFGSEGLAGRRCRNQVQYPVRGIGWPPAFRLLAFTGFGQSREVRQEFETPPNVIRRDHRSGRGRHGTKAGELHTAPAPGSAAFGPDGQADRLSHLHLAGAGPPTTADPVPLQPTLP
jgi:hypothetical protein